MYKDAVDNRLLAEITQFPIKKLTLYEKNPRKVSKEQFEKLCISLEKDTRFMTCRPVLVNERDGQFLVYAGNQRVRAAKKLKWITIPCIIEKDLSDDVIKQRVIKDNQHYGEFDFDMLANDYEIDDLLEAGFEGEDLIGKMVIEEIESLDEPEKDSKKKTTVCPSCGHEF